MENWEYWALAVHTKDCQEGINWANFKTVLTEPYNYKRTIMEALEIQRNEVCNMQHPVINDRAGQYFTTDSWKHLLRKIGNK